MGAAPLRCVPLWLGTFQWSFAAELNVPPAERPAHLAHLFAAPVVMPLWCFLIETATATVLVDAGDIAAFAGTPYGLEGAPPADLAAYLAAVGVAPEDITHVVITHAHFDHYTGVATAAGAPRFPNARHLLGRADWEREYIQRQLGDPASWESRSLGVIQRAGLLDLIVAPVSFGPGLEVIPLPGETPSHLGLRAWDDATTYLCVGDLYHHPIEISYPQWMPTSADLTASLRSRAWFTELALATDAVVAASHFPTLGRLSARDNWLTWAPAAG